MGMTRGGPLPKLTWYHDLHPIRWTTEHMALAIALLVSIILLCVVLITVSRHNNCLPPNPRQAQLDEMKLHMAPFAESVLANMDLSVDPCHDFYSYSCGGFVKKGAPSGKPRWDIFSLLQQRNREMLQKLLKDGWPLLKTLYDDCLAMDTRNAAGLVPLQPAISLLSDLQTTYGSEPRAQALGKLLGVWHAAGIDALFKLDTQPDLYNPALNLLQFSQGGIGMDTPADYNPTSNPNYGAYKDHIARSMALLNAEPAGHTPSPASLQEAEDALQVESLLAAHSLSPADRRNDVALFHRTSASQLQAMIPAISLTTYLGPTIAGNLTQANVQEPNFMAAVSNITSACMNAADPDQSVECRQLYAYLKWSLVRATGDFLTTDLVNEMWSWVALTSGATHPPTLEESCVDKCVAAMPFLTSRYYVMLAFSQTAKDDAQELIDLLQQAMDDNFASLSWMDAATKAAARKKLSMFTKKIGYPDKWPSYTDVFLTPGKFYEHIAFLNTRLSLKARSTQGGVADKSQWMMAPEVVNAYYNPQWNEIVFPAAILQHPFYADGQPAPLNFGGIACVIGHEITHGFDDQGRHYDGTGNYTNWWTPESASHFDQRAQCVVDQYDNYHPIPKKPEVHINGKLTLGENLADAGGLKIASMALNNWWKKHANDVYEEAILDVFGLTPQQLYFVAFGQNWCNIMDDKVIEQMVKSNPHSPGTFRALGPTSMNRQWHEVFNCPIPKGKPFCEVW